MSNFCSLTHTFGIASDFLVHDIGQPNELQNALSLFLCFISGQSMEASEGGHELVRCHPIVHVFIFWDITNTGVRSWIFPRIGTEQAHLSLRWLKFPHQEFEQGRFSCTIETENSGYTTTEGERNPSNGLIAPVGLAHVVEHHNRCLRLGNPLLLLSLPFLGKIWNHSRVTSIEETRTLRTYSAMALIATTEASDQIQGWS